MKHGRLIDEMTLPKLTVILNSFVFSTINLDISRLPVVKLKTLPPLLACHT